MNVHDYSRREFCQVITTGAAMAVLGPQTLMAAETTMLKRKVPATGEELPVIGLGSAPPRELTCAACSQKRIGSHLRNAG